MVVSVNYNRIARLSPVVWPRLVHLPHKLEELESEESTCDDYAVCGEM